LNNTLHLIVVQDSELFSENLEPRAGVGTHENKVTFLAPRTCGELGGIFVRVGADSEHEQHCGGVFFYSQSRGISNEVEGRASNLLVMPGGRMISLI